MNKLLLANWALRFMLFALFASWLILFIVNPVKMYPDSYGYFENAKNLFDPAQTMTRPILYSIFIRIIMGLHLKASIVSYLLNCASLLYLMRMAAGKGPLFSIQNTIVLVCLFMLTGIWSYCGTYLTESILPAVESWIFILLVKIFLPAEKIPVAGIIGYSVLIFLLATTLKPWIMVAVLMIGALLLLASFSVSAFREKRRPALLFFAVSILLFMAGLSYNRSKSFEKANMVVFMAGSGYEGRLEQRLTEGGGPGGDSSRFMADVLADIRLINTKFGRDPFQAVQTTELKVLNFQDKNNAPNIDRAFHVMYMEHFRDAFGLVGLAFERYISRLRLGTSCFEIAYGPELPGIRKLGFIFIILLLGMTILRWPRHDKPLAIFMGIILLAGVLYGLLLSLPVAEELQRTVLPAPLFEVLALAYILFGTTGRGVSAISPSSYSPSPRESLLQGPGLP